MTKTVNVTDEKMIPEVIMDWLQSGEASLLVRQNNSEELAVRYPYSESSDNVEAIVSMNVKDGFNRIQGTWSRNGFWFKDKKLFLVKKAVMKEHHFSNVVLYRDVLNTMRKALLEKVWEMFTILYPTRDSLEASKMYNSALKEEYTTRETELDWLHGKLRTNAKEIFFDKLLFHPWFNPFEEDEVIDWFSGNEEKVLTEAMNTIKENNALVEGPGRLMISVFRVGLLRAYILSEKAKNYTPSAKILASMKIAGAVFAYVKKHGDVKNFNIVCKNSEGQIFKGKIRKNDVLDADSVYSSLPINWIGKGFIDPEDKWKPPAADNVMSVSYRNDTLYEKA